MEGSSSLQEVRRARQSQGVCEGPRLRTKQGAHYRSRPVWYARRHRVSASRRKSGKN